MRLLFLTPQLPFPPQQGTSIRNFNIINVLSERHEVHLLTFGRNEELEGSPLLDLCRRVELVRQPIRSLSLRAWDTFFSPLPDMAHRLASAELQAKLKAMLETGGYQVLQIEGIEMSARWSQVAGPGVVLPDISNSLTPRIREKTNPESLTVVFDDHNAEYVLQKTAFESDRRHPERAHAALYSFIQYLKLKRFERKICLASGRVAAVSENDAIALTSLDSRIKPTIVPNGVDLVRYVPSDAVCAKPLSDVSVVFTGKMDFRPNVDAAIWFVEEILPILRREIPLAHVSFVGQKPTAQVQALATRPGVQVTGWVPDTRPYIADAPVYVVPLRMGGGTRLKVLEAMAMGKAIVCTKIGAEGIACVSGRDLTIADRPEDFARAIASLIRDPSKRKELGTNARRLVEAKYNWKSIVPLFESFYRSAG